MRSIHRTYPTESLASKKRIRAFFGCMRLFWVRRAAFLKTDILKRVPAAFLHMRPFHTDSNFKYNTRIAWRGTGVVMGIGAARRKVLGPGRANMGLGRSAAGGCGFLGHRLCDKRETTRREYCTDSTENSELILVCARRLTSTVGRWSMFY